MIDSSPSLKPFFFTLLPFSGMGVFFLLWATPYGIGLSADTAGYLCAARSFLEGKGFIGIPKWDGTGGSFTYYAPFFALLLSSLGLLGMDPLEGARLLNTFLFSLNIGLAGFITFRYTRSLVPSVLSAFLLLFSFVILEIHAMAISEPLFIFLTFLGLYLLSLYLEKSSKPSLLVGASFFLSLAFFTKYSGVSVIFTGAASLLLLSSRPVSKKMQEVLVFMLISCLPMALWILRNQTLMGDPTATGLTLRFYPYLLPSLRELVAFTSVWLLPHAVPKFFRGLVLFLTVSFFGGAIFSLRKERGETSPKILDVLWLIIISHIGIYFLTTAFLGRQILDDRALSPVYFALVVSLPSLGHRLWQISSQRGIRPALGLMTFFFTVSSFGRSLGWREKAGSQGLGYEGPQWRESQVMEEVKKLPAGTAIYTNGIDVIYLLGKRFSTALPPRENIFNPASHDPKQKYHLNYFLEIQKMKEDMEENQGVLVYFDKISWRTYYPTAAELEREIPLEIAKRVDGGTLYRVKST